MRKFLIEGCCDGSLFSETVEAQSLEDAEAFAIERLCEAWGEDYGPHTTLDDLGDAASVTEYAAEDYARDAAAEMLAFVEQISRMTSATEADRQDLDNDLAMDGLIVRARALAAKARGEA